MQSSLDTNSPTTYNSSKVTFQITVAQLTMSSPLPEEDIDICVTISISDVSKITCFGELSEDSLTITWNHPFLFTAHPSASIVIAIYSLPVELTAVWDKKPLGDHMVTDVANLLESSNGWQCNVLGLLHCGPVTLSMTCSTCDEWIVPNDHGCCSALWNYADKLEKLFNQFQNVAAVSTFTETRQTIMDLCPTGHAYHIQALGSLAVAFTVQYNILGDIPDLNRAIETGKKMLDLCFPGHEMHSRALQRNADCLWRLYWVQRNVADLEKTIEIAEQWFDLCPLGHPDHANALAFLALFLESHFDVQGNITELNKAIEMMQNWLVLFPDHHQTHLALGNLGNSFYKRYGKQRNLADLNKAIELREKCITLCPPGHPYHSEALSQLALSLQTHYGATKTHSNLTWAIQLFEEALGTYSVQHQYFPPTVQNLAEAILCQSKYSGLSIDKAFETYRLLKGCGPAVSMCLWIATQAWIWSAEYHNHPSALGAYQTSLNTLDYLISMQSSVDSRHEAIQARARVADLANDAFSCSVRHGNLRVAVELLEQGRGILWSQLARFDTSLAMLESQGTQGRQLARKFAQLSSNLRKHAQGSAEKEGEPYWRVHEEWKSVVDEIRSQDGFSQFLLPPHFDDLQQAAERGPVIIVNASKYTCDALIILHDQSPLHVSLDCSLDNVKDLCWQFSALTQDPHAYGKNREPWVKQSLRELWSSVVEPIVTILQDDVQLPTGSRIWWYPTSDFTILPFHAAGPYRRTQKNLMDIYVSSYAPSLSALIRTRERVRSQKQSHGNANTISFAAIGQAHPSADLKLLPLPEVEFEIQKILNEASVAPDVSFEVIAGAAATIEGAVQAFRDHRWIHLACHGAQHANKPFESWFVMGDGPLTLMRIIQERYTRSEFAFLSACHTAVGDESTPDEVIHLAAGMQFAGFNGVIGTLWRVDDSTAHRVVARFYKEMFDRPVVDFEYAATALNTAVAETVDEVALEKRIVFVHIGI